MKEEILAENHIKIKQIADKSVEIVIVEDDEQKDIELPIVGGYAEINIAGQRNRTGDIMNKNKGKIHFAWWVLIGLSIMVGLGRGGLNNSGGLFLTPVSQELGIGMGRLSLYFSIASIVMMIFLPIAGKLMAKYDIRLILIGAIVFQAGSFAMFGLMNSVWGWYVFSIPMAFGAIFITQMAGPVLVNQWFKKRGGLAIGIMMASSGAIGAIIQPLVGNLINGQGWRSAYIITGLVVIAISVPVILFFIRKPQDKKMLAYGEESIDNGSKETKGNQGNSGVTLAVAKKSSAFYALIFFFFLITSFGSFAMHIPSYAMGLGHDIAFAGSLMSGFLIGSVVGSIAFGFLSDKIGAKKTALMAMAAGMLAVVLLLLFAQNTIILVLAVVIFGLVTSSIGTLGPVLTSSLFGHKEYSQIFSNASLGLAAAGIISLPAYGFIFEYTGSYKGALLAILIMLIVAIPCIIIAFKGKKKMIDEGLWD